MIDCQCITTVAATNLTVIRSALNYHGDIRAAQKNQEIEAEVKWYSLVDTAPGNSFSLNMVYFVFLKLLEKEGLVHAPQWAGQRIQRRSYTLVEKQNT